MFDVLWKVEAGNFVPYSAQQTKYFDLFNEFLF